MSDTEWLLAIGGAAALLVLAHRQGLRLNWRLAKAVAEELEEALQPTDATYTWIGGAIGFHATYELPSGATAKATTTLLPRQSPLYLPFAYLTSGFDKLQLTFDGTGPTSVRALLFDDSFLRRKLGVPKGVEGLTRQELTIGGRRLVLFSSGDASAAWARELAEELRDQGLLGALKQVALGGAAPLFFMIRPAPGLSSRFTAAALVALERLPGAPNR